MDNLKKYISVFEDFDKVLGKITVEDFLNDIRIRETPEIKNIREHWERGQKSEIEFLKRRLRAVTLAGTFKNGRNEESLEAYNSIMTLNFDNLESSLERVIQAVKKCPYTLAGFLSPTGNGYTAMVYAESTPETHQEVYQDVLQHYQKITNTKLILSCEDITQLCFYSFDPDVYINRNAATFYQKNKENAFSIFNPPVEPDKTNKSNNNKQLNKNIHKMDQFTQKYNLKAFELAVSLTNKKLKNEEGNKNNFLYFLAYNCNLSGVPENEAISLISESYNDLEYQDIASTVSSIYNPHTIALNDWQLLQVGNSSDKPFKSDLGEMPYLPAEAIELLPKLLKKSAAAFSFDRDRDVYLTGALAILSGCLPGISGEYAGKLVYPNLYSFIVASAATGKGALNYAKELGNKHHAQLLEENEVAQQKYKLEAEAYRELIKANKGKAPAQDPPLEPAFKVHFIPANASSSRVIQHLKDNDEKGIFCETEADSMGNALKQDWGGYSDLLRKAYHHECVSITRKKEKEYTEIRKPKLSVALAGTPDQVSGLIKSAEDGLFSRFLFYAFDAPVDWQDVSPSAHKNNLETFFQGMSLKVKDMIQFDETYPSNFFLTNQQWNELNITCGEWLDLTCAEYGNGASSIIKRLGLAIFRICMIFTAIHRYETYNKATEINCSDAHFKAAMMFANVYREHCLEVYKSLPNSQTGNSSNPKQNKFYTLLPEKVSFQRKEALKIASDIKISTKSADNYLKRLSAEGLLEQGDYGMYYKP